jgi:hypothetical protein
MATERTWKVQNDRRAVKRDEVAKGSWVRKWVSACLSGENLRDNMGLKISEEALMVSIAASHLNRHAVPCIARGI